MTPETETELAEMVAGAKGPLRVQGGGTRPIGAPIKGEILSTAALTGIVDYEPGALTLVAKAGTPVAEMERVLAAEGQRLAFEPMDHRALLGTQGEPTIGGVVAGNVSGPRRIAVGAARDFLLGVRFVDGAGRVLKNGGRVMKNVTGYDLVKLMAGSRGTLGVLSEVSLKVLPRPDVSATLIWEGLDWTAALRLFSEALGSPFEVTGAARLERDGPGGRSKTLIRIEGFEKSVKYRAERLAGLSPKLGRPQHIETGAPENAAMWQAVRDVAPFAGRCGHVWRVSVKPSDMIAITGKNEAEHLVDWGGGLIWSLAPEGMNLRAGLEEIGGHATLIRGEAQGGAPVFQPEAAPLARISQALRARFDPRGILNPGLMG